MIVYAVAPAFNAPAETIYRAFPPRAIGSGTEPQLSPDGRRVAFLRGTVGYVMRADGTHVRRLGTAYAIEWTPDGRTLRWGRRTLALGGKIVVRRAVGAASVSPDGSELAYEPSVQQHPRIVVLDLRSGRVRATLRDAYLPVWGPDALAYACRSDICLWQGGRARRLTHTGARIVPADWSADGRRLLADNPAMHNGRLWAVDVPSGRARPLTPWRGDLFPQGLSRDGRTVLAAIGCGGTMSPFGYVETIPFAGGKPRVLVRGPCRASWNR